jgi:hypothetical protein
MIGVGQNVAREISSSFFGLFAQYHFEVPKKIESGNITGKLNQ